MHAELPSQTENVKHHWSGAAILVAGLGAIALGAGFAGFAIGSVDLRITMVVAVVMGIAATVAANARSQDTAHGAAWLGVWLSLAFLLAGAIQELWKPTSITLPLLDAGFAALLALINLKFATIVSRRA
jgi:hypothetical protein